MCVYKKHKFTLLLLYYSNVRMCQQEVAGRMVSGTSKSHLTYGKQFCLTSTISGPSVFQNAAKQT